MHRALLRDISNTFDRAVVGELGRAPDVDQARRQHGLYRKHLERAGYLVTVLPSDDSYPDGVFVEDTAVVMGGVALVTLPGEPTRVGEVHATAEALSAEMPVTYVHPPGTLDGGDVMSLGNRVWVGRSARSNSEGISQLSGVAHEQGLEVTVVPVTDVLHLKSAVLPVGPDSVVVTSGTVEEALLADLQILHEDPAERHRFSALPMIDGRVLVTKSAPRTAELVASRGLNVEPIDVSEILAADGGLTCMSILYEG